MHLWYLKIFIIICIVLVFYYILNNKLNKNEDITPMTTVPNVIVNLEDLKKHAEEISKHYSDVMRGHKNKILLEKLNNNYTSILDTYKKTEEYQENYSDTLHAGEWLLDNMFLITKEYKELKDVLKYKSYRNLPVLSKGIMKGYPRIYHIAVEMISHSDGYIDEDIIEEFLEIYQKNTILTSKELWALPVMIKIALIENIRKVCDVLSSAQEQKTKADFIAERIIKSCNENRIKYELDKISEEDIEFTYFFMERLFKILKDNGVENRQVYDWIDEKLEINELNYENIIVEEHKEEAAIRVTIGNCINSIRRIEGLNYGVYFEKLSYVEKLLKQDPINIYEKMDISSKDYYRHNIEKLSKRYNLPESFIVKRALECANEAKDSKDKYKKHIGYYLIDDGVECLKSKLNIKENNFKKIFKYMRYKKLETYLGTTIIGTLLIVCLFLYVSLKNDTNIQIWRYIVAVLALIIPVSEIVISLVNYSVNLLISPRFIPKLNLKDCIDDENRTIIIVPTIISSIKNADKLIEKLEVSYLSNSDSNLYFAILGDFKDSNKQYEEEDGKIAEYVLDRIKQLNLKYSKDDNIFFYLSRYRKYNDKEHKWLAYERKRGKIMEFVQLLKGKSDTSYDIISSDISKLKKAKYILTLDSDTKLPRDAASKLVGSMAHVLNKPIIDLKKNRVTRGYGLLQPRISISVTSSNKTFFSKIFSGETGIDIYTTAVSDVYQDLFGEGTFVGKGIFDIDVFYTMLNNKIPENSVLSHDLLEGCFVKAGLVSDIELIDDYPSNYNSSCKRLHRWVRGDWQLIPWIFKNKDLNRLSKFKLIDNLRRSLLPVSIIILLILSFNVLPNGTDKWIIAAILALICPIIFNVSQFFISPRKDISLSGRVTSFNIIIFQIFFIVCFLPHKAILMLDAIFRTIYRLTITKEHLLEWQTAEEAEKKSAKTLISYIKLMWLGSAIGCLIIILSFNKSLQYGISTLPFCLIWILSPLIAYEISQERCNNKDTLNIDQIHEVRKISRRIYAYFEDFVNEETNYLAPDNYQRYPKGELAYRTSPTNLGMGLMADIVGFDLGYIGILKLIENLSNTFNSMDKLEKFNGHYYNWYNIKTMKPLYPRYVSSVDSGNLVGYLWVISQSLHEYCNTKINLNKYINGLRDISSLADKELNNKTYFYNMISENKENINIFEFYQLLIKLKNEIGKISLDINKNYWVKKFKNQVQELKCEFEYIFPWLKNCLKNSNEYIETIKLVSSLTISEIGNIKNNNQKINHTKQICKSIINEINSLIDRINEMSEKTDFSIVFDEDKKLFSIGYDIENNGLSKSYYDLLASESRQASFVAIAKGDIEQENWFKLGRSLTLIGNGKGLISWSGTMFEYFMPLLIMKNYSNTLFSETYNFVLQGQKKYCNSKHIPWGVSESAFYYFDSNLNYQYKAFGIPGIGVKRGLNNELVISPYSTFLAMQINHRIGYENIIELKKEEALGKYGFYESIDYTKNRVKGKKKCIIKSFMVHHQGMSIMAIDNILNDNILQKRFHSIPKVKATELLLQERPSKNIVYKNDNYYNYEPNKEIKDQTIIVRKYNTPKTLVPQVNLLSNGEFSLMISNSGSGYTKKGDILLYRYKNDVTLDNSGMFFYIKDISNNKYFSAAYEPCKVIGEVYRVEFSLDKAVFKRKDGNLITKTEVIVSNEDNAEIRKISITNKDNKEKIIEVTSYCEITLSKYLEDAAHPSFQDLFIQTQYLDEYNCVVAKRRCRKKEDNEKWIMQTVVVNGDSIGSLQYETSKINFVGRGNNLTKPTCMENDAALKNNTGIVLCPIISIRRRVKIQPSSKCEVIYTTAIGNSKDEIINLAKKYSEYTNIVKCFKLAYTQCQLDIKYLGIKSAQANLYQMVASKILFLDLYNNRNEKYIKNINGSQQMLWKYGISGDLPIMLVICKENKDIDIVRQILKAHEYYDLKGLKTDLVIVNMQDNSYDRPLENSIRDLILSSISRDKMYKNGGVFLINKSSINEQDLSLLRAIAKITIDSEEGPLVCQIKNKINQKNNTNRLETQNVVYESQNVKLLNEKLKYFNGYGGFSENGEKYIILLDDDKNTPLPWINVISNKKFGFIVSERGSMYTWNLNSRENKLSTWSNDWISDWCDENIYIRDEINGEIWSPTCNPIRTKGEYLIEHGFGYSTFKHNYNGIGCELTAFVPKDDSVKICIINFKNTTNQIRKLSLTYFSKLVLGTISEQTAQYISTYIDKNGKYIYGINPYNKNFRNLKAYLKIIGGSEESFTGDETGFIGRCGDYKNPEMLLREFLSNRVGVNMQPCLAENVKFNIEPLKSKNIIILFGESTHNDDIDNIINKYSNINRVIEELENVKFYWKDILHKVQVNTPDMSMNIMMNGWLMYQTICCRIWAKTAFYQCGGAYGFRDQLQDVMNAVYINPELTKAQIIYSASKQYLEGDVQHWWHPIVNSGIRTRYSDDLLWLPYVTSNYISSTGDYDVLDEMVSYLEDDPLKENEDERYKISNVSEKKGSLYEHCLKAIDRALKFGEHNIPLMGSGDWNDGMNKVGNKGKGESVWLAFFLYNILDNFIPICNLKGDNDKKIKYIEMKKYIKDNIEKNAWDGNWYKRAFFDDGTPLGSIENDECQIDSISQSWSVISKCGDIDRAKIAMQSLENNLVKKNKGMILLLNPPFDKSNLEPGYIKGYVPGVRENGGQYTHAACWVILAFSKLKMQNKAWMLFNLINPINHTSSYFECQNYKAEPYVMAADVYAKEPHEGRGGWTWYTGSAGWMYRAGIEGILGLKLHGENGFSIEPCIPKEWNGYELTYKKDNCIYNIKIQRSNKVQIKVDQNIIDSKIIPYFKDGEHEIEVYIE